MHVNEVLIIYIKFGKGQSRRQWFIVTKPKFQDTHTYANWKCKKSEKTPSNLTAQYDNKQAMKGHREEKQFCQVLFSSSRTPMDSQAKISWLWWQVSVKSWMSHTCFLTGADRGLRQGDQDPGDLLGPQQTAESGVPKAESRVPNSRVWGP
jgi:hypothetical protein